jgi:LemA protein
MRTGQWVFLAAAAVIVFWMVGAYNRLVAMRSAIGDAYRQFDELLQRRADAAATLESQARAVLVGEEGAIDAWQALRAASHKAADTLRARPVNAELAQALAGAEAALAASTARVLALLEQQQARLAPAAAAQLAALLELDARIGFARQVFNEAAKAYDEALAEVPTRVLARLYRFTPAGRL